MTPDGLVPGLMWQHQPAPNRITALKKWIEAVERDLELKDTNPYARNGWQRQLSFMRAELKNAQYVVAHATGEDERRWLSEQ